MDPQRWQRVSEIFHEACERPAGERDAFVRAACADDERLIEDVRTLLAQDDDAERALAGVVMGAVDRLVERTPPGTRVGRYAIVRELGRGGMGAVYLARRADGEFDQQVALKLIKPGMDTEQILHRFRAERQILARLQHPNIARLLDGGMTEQGLPYFAMEYVAGQRIDRYCAEHRLALDARLDLFAYVCRAVMHAHAQLVVHSDLKPANILVTAEGQVRLLDFGLARLLTEESGGEATQLGLRALTPAYAAPEQVRGEPVGTAADVYALGVILYELVTGERPYHVDHANPAEIERVVCTTQPDPPSARIARAASAGTPAPFARSHRRVTGDLDLICLKTLRKEPERRYGSVEALLADLQAYRDGFPISARPDSARYRLGRFIARHRAGIGIAAALLLAVSGLVGFYTVRLATERDRAQLESARAAQVADFLRGIFAVTDPRVSGGETITARELLDDGAERLESELVSQPELRASLMRLIGEVYSGLGLDERARPILERALAEHRRMHGVDHADVATDALALGIVLQNLEDLPAADSMLHLSLSVRERLGGASHPDAIEVLHHITNLRVAQGDYAGAIDAARRVLAAERAREPVDAEREAAAAVRLGGLLSELGADGEAESLLRTGLARQRSLYGARDLRVASTARNLGSLLRQRGALDEAEPFLREAVEIRRRALGDSHSDVATTLASYASLLVDRGEIERGLAALREAIEVEERASSTPTANLAAFHHNLGIALRDAGRDDEAVAEFTESVRIQDAVLPPTHPNRAFPRMSLGGTLMAAGRYADAEPLLREAVAVRRGGLPAGHRYTGESLSALGECLAGLRQWDEAEAVLGEALEILSAAEGSDASRTHRTRERIEKLKSARSGRAPIP